MLKLNHFYTAPKQIKIESRGPRFEAGDFVVKIGSVTMASAFKGILVEVHYTTLLSFICQGPLASTLCPSRDLSCYLLDYLFVSFLS